MTLLCTLVSPSIGAAQLNGTENTIVRRLASLVFNTTEPYAWRFPGVSPRELDERSPSVRRG